VAERRSGGATGGYLKVKLWVQADSSDDMDLFVAIEKFDRSGYLVPFAFFGNHDDGAVALGWQG
jgi:hypothetical protein